MTTTKTTLFAILGMLLLFINSLSAQEETNQINIATQDLILNTDKIIFENDQLKVSVRKLDVLDDKDGIHHERVTFQYVNKTSTPISFKFNKLNIYNESSGRGEGNSHMIELPGNTTKEYSQTNKTKSYYSFQKDLKGTIKAELKYIILNKITIS
jgi:hypothetical protein